MPIEFDCPHCGRLMRSPDGSAGKKGRCPDCGGIAQIPLASTAGVSVDAPAGSSPAAASGTIEFPCRQCKQMVRVPAAHAGKKGKCPHCQAITQIPSASAPPARQASPSAAQAPSPSAAQASASQPGKASQAGTAGGPVSFNCPSCRRLVKTPASAAGKKGKCPHCAEIVQIPLRSTATVEEPRKKPQSRDSGGLTPLPDSGGLTPLPDAGGLTPLPDAGGLTPLPEAGGLTPLDDFGGLTPLPDAGGGLQPLSDPLAMGGAGADPFAGSGQLPAADPYAAWSGPAAAPAPYGATAYGASNPYAVPSPAASARTTTKRSGGGGSRKGLPWDRGESGAFFATIKMVLFDPTTAYSRMSLTGGIGGPLGFAVLGSLFGAAITLAYSLLLYGVLMILVMSVGNGERTGPLIAALAVSFGQQFVAYLVWATLGTTIFSFVAAAFLHLLLMMFGGANQQYEATYRVVCYSIGAVSGFAVLPLCGYLVALFAYPIYLIVGLAYGHETDAWRTACAVLLPFVLCCVGTATLYIMLVGLVFANA